MHKTTKRKPRARTMRALRARHHHGISLAHPLNGFKNSLHGMGEDFSDKTSRIVAKSIRKARAQSKRVGRYVTKKPYRSIGFAVAACIVLGFLASR